MSKITASSVKKSNIDNTSIKHYSDLKIEEDLRVEVLMNKTTRNDLKIKKYTAG